jgi:flagellar hook protein FlgE
MLQALLASVASIKAQQSRMNVIGDNLANVNTTAFKGSRVLFQEMMAQTIRVGNNPIQFGQGVLVGSTDTDNGQGSLNATNRPGDLALQGSGYFVIANGSGYSYSRDGSFDLDQNGNLIQKSTGEKVLGWSADSGGNIDSAGGITPASTINVPVGSLNAFKVTSSVSMAGNLDSSAKATDSWSTNVRVFDSLGGAHDITIKFSNHSAPPKAGGPAGSKSSWDWSASENGAQIASSSGAGNKSLYFDATGKMLNPTALSNITVPATATTGATAIKVDFSGIGQIAGTSQVQTSGQDGFPPGQLQTFAVGNDGTVTGVFSNGLTRSLGRVAVAQFSNPGGLARLGGNLFGSTNGSGAASIGVAGEGGRGSIAAGFLEQSNIDIGTQFTDLIITQRGFQANAKVVTTVDEMLQDLLNIKR